MGQENSSAKKAKGKVRFNIIDFLIVIVIIGAIVGIALRYGLVEKVTNQSALSSARISFLIQDINEDSSNYFGIGDEFTALDFSCDLGELESRQFIPAEAFITNQYGEIIKTHSNDNRIDVRGTMIGEGTFTEDGFLLDGLHYIAPGTTIHMQSANIDVFMTVTAIEQIEDINK
ncbi:MAG: DUF4330 family protein [Clostridiales bacterium]|nr:DUF4330 family protein [Clostridiales bacterium]